MVKYYFRNNEKKTRERNQWFNFQVFKDKIMETFYSAK